MLRYLAAAAVSVVFGLSAAAAIAGPVLIIHGQSATSEDSTTRSITTNLKTLHEAVGNTVTLADSVPGSLAGFTQVWDIRFSNSSPIDAATRTQYVSFLAAGGGMFVMGENSGFMTRNNSVLSLISDAGGGSLAFQTANNNEVVRAPFTGPNAVTNIVFFAPGGTSTAGTGDFIATNDGSSTGPGAGVAFGVGDLASALAGALTVIFDVNFMELLASGGNVTGYDGILVDGNGTPEQFALTKNLIGFVGDQVDPPAVPAPATALLLGVGLAALGAMRRRD